MKKLKKKAKMKQCNGIFIFQCLFIMKDEYYISSLYHNNKTRYRLIQLFKIFSTPPRDDIMALFVNKLSDETIIKCLIYFANSKPEQQSAYSNKLIDNRIIGRAKRYHNIIKNTPIENTIGKYLDIGCNNGVYTVALGNLLKLNKSDIYGIDLGKFAGMSIEPIDGFNYKDYDGVNIPYDDNSFDLISMFMVFHHVNRPNELMSEIKRVTKKGGLILLREHDTENNNMYKKLFTLEHYLYNIFYDKIDFEKFKKEYYDNYYSKSELIKMFSDNGFKYIEQNEKIKRESQKFYKLNNPTNYYQITFVKQ